MKYLVLVFCHLVIAPLFSLQATMEGKPFLDGFPDVPLVAGMTENEDERVVFDTPAGTVAETSIRADIAGQQMLDLYEDKLLPFGWACVRHPLSLTCKRENNRLLFLDKTLAGQNGLIILRLEPLK